MFRWILVLFSLHSVQFQIFYHLPLEEVSYGRIITKTENICKNELQLLKKQKLYE